MIDVPLIRIFSCWRVATPAAVFERVVEIVAEARRVAAAYPVEVVLENEHDCNVATAAETIALLDAVPDLRIIWDRRTTCERAANLRIRSHRVR